MSSAEKDVPQENPAVETVRGPGQLLKEEPFRVAKEHAAWILALALFLLLAVIIAGHYAVVACFYVFGSGGCPETLNDIASSSLAVVAGLFGSVTTYYYTVERKS